MKQYWLYIYIILSALTSLTACQDDNNELPFPSDNEAGLYVSLTVSGEAPLYPNVNGSRAISNGEDNLGENTVASVDFYLFDTNGSLITVNGQSSHWRQTVSATTSETVDDTIFHKSPVHTLYSGSDWRTAYTQITNGCKLYAIVNLNETIAKDITTLSGLQSTIVTDNNIYLKDTNGNKRFLMDGVYTFGSETFSATESYTKTIDVYRAAAKVRVNLYKDAGWPATEKIGLSTVTAGLENYVPTTEVLKEAAMWTSTEALPDVAEDATDKITAYNRYEGISTTAPDNYVGSILFYTFANDWSQDDTRETCLRMNIPYGSDPANGSFTQATNRYKLVFLPNDQKKLDRNTFYEVNAKIHHAHSEEEIKGEWEVEKWVTKNVNVEAVESPDYLVLSDYYIDVRNEDHTTLTYYSSNNITVELVSFANESDLNKQINTNQATTIRQELTAAGFKGYSGSPYTGSYYDMKDIPAVYYVDKNNERIDIEHDPKAIYNKVETNGYASLSASAPTQLPDTHEVYIAYPNDKDTKGTIDIFSAIPRNVTARYITLKVSMQTKDGGTLCRYAVIKQYPLVYVERRYGLCSYADGNVKHHKEENGEEQVYDKEWGFEWYEGIKRWDTGNKGQYVGFVEITKNVYESMNTHLSTTGSFRPKFFSPDIPWTTSEGTRNGCIFQTLYNVDKDTVGIFNNDGANNNHMYEMVVTSTSSQYKIGYPEMVLPDGETDDHRKVAVSSEENNKLVSPRFMFASQLGNNPATKFWETARDLCKKYVEVEEVNGDTIVHRDWRLPTIAELEFVKNHQNDDDVYDITMAKVLNADGDTNSQYWTAGENVFVYTTSAGKETNINDAPAETEVRIRCVRDVKASEINE